MTSATCRVLFVCTGNICRSPMAEIVARQLRPPETSPYIFQSAGTASWHAGEPMDPRAATALAAKGYKPELHRAQHGDDLLLANNDLVLGLDRKHQQILNGRLERLGKHPAQLLRPFDPAHGGAVDIADPYYGDQEDFTESLELIERSVRGLVVSLDATFLT